jgi:sialate O-acetylesterase
MNSKTKLSKLVFISLFFIYISVFSQVKLPRLISDGMVLQRDAKVKIWGWSAANEKISINFKEKIYHTSANEKGEWSIILTGLKPGGPFSMTITASNTITIKDIMVGDVWLCSGQSNIELPMKRVSPIYEAEIADSENPNIRHFVVPQKYNFNTPEKDIESGSWQTASPNHVLNFSAVAYFFAKELFEKNHIPIGLINASLGGSPIESWISEEAIKSFPVPYEEAQRFKDPALIKQIESQDRIRINTWYGKLWKSDEGYKDPLQPWYTPDLNTSGWATMKLPGYWKDGELGSINGSVWFRKEINIPASMAGKPAKLILGRIIDADSAFLNGVFVGTISYQYPPRRYDVPAGVLREGKNNLTVRVISNIGNGGFVLDKRYQLFSGKDTVDLTGEWKYRLGAKMDPLESETFIRWKPVGLYNAMISPLHNYAIKGALWYQGESNAGRYTEYLKLLPALVKDWRKRWDQGDFPFLYVQLPNYGDAKNQPSEGGWASFRESQLKSLSIPKTAMVVTIDIGEWNDIHPINKKDVGKRLAIAAQRVAYGNKNIVYSGPLYQSMEIKGNKIILSFTNTGSGLTSKDGELKHFAVKGADNKFVWAKAKIENNKVVVWCEDVPNPVAVRYAWADNPAGANLYNKEGLPASPFRTDTDSKGK